MEGLRDRLDPADYTWAKIKPALLRQYGGIVDKNQHVNKLHSARMGRETPVRKFAQEVERLARLAYPELASDGKVGTSEQRAIQKGILNRITLEQFVSGLPPMLSRPVAERQIEDFDKAVDFAAHLEEINSRYFKKSTINAFFSSEADNSNSASAPTDAATQGTTPQRQTDRQRKPNRARGPSVPRGGHAAVGRNNRVDGIQCYRCGEMGHRQYDCSRTRCYICGDGHPAAACTNIVCARCKQPGHPANRCSKNSGGHPPHTTTS